MNASPQGFPTEFEVDGQITIGMYLDACDLPSSVPSKNIARKSVYFLSCFERSFGPQKQEESPEESELSVDQEDGILTAIKKGMEEDPEISLFQKIRKKPEQMVRFYVLTDRDTGYTRVSFSVQDGKYPAVKAVNQALYAMGSVPARIIIEHMPKTFDGHLIKQVLESYQITVSNSLRKGKKLSPLAKLLMRACREMSWDDLRNAIPALEDSINLSPTGDAFGSQVRCSFEYRQQFMRKLPKKPFQLVERKKLKVQFNYHVEVEGKFYSIPKQFKGMQVFAEVTEMFVEIQTLDGVIIYVHNNHWADNSLYITNLNHMPDPSEIPYKDRNGKRFLLWADHHGEHVFKMCRRFLTQGSCEMQGYIPCMSLIRLDIRFGSEILDQACKEEMELVEISRGFPEISRIRFRCEQMSSSRIAALSLEEREDNDGIIEIKYDNPVADECRIEDAATDPGLFTLGCLPF